MNHQAPGWLLSLMILAAPGPAQAELSADFPGLRSDAMGGAHRGLGTSNDTMMLNPAGMVMVKRYSIDMLYGYGARERLSQFGVTAVDSKSGPVAGGMGYVHDRTGKEDGDVSLHRTYAAVAYPIMNGLGFGISGRYLRGDFKDEDGQKQKPSLWTGDLGVAARLGEFVGVGFAYHNIIKTDLPKLTPPTLGFGLSFSNPFLAIAADVVVNIRKRKNRDVSYHIGGEYFVANAYPLRAGYRLVPFTTAEGDRSQESIITAGAAWISGGGALEATATRSVQRPRNWSITGALKFFL